MFLELNRMPYSIFSAAIMILCVIGAFGLNNSMDDLYLMFAFSRHRLRHAQVRHPRGAVHPGAGSGGHGGAVPAAVAAAVRRAAPRSWSAARSASSCSRVRCSPSSTRCSKTEDARRGVARNRRVSGTVLSRLWERRSGTMGIQGPPYFRSRQDAAPTRA
ncbi:MAG: tripartite tricarboxylate transporter permease [Desulfobacterales bacterium]|nr:tripartite tricarboxylate transporter permease [Desulfobacterales bacterium]